MPFYLPPSLTLAVPAPSLSWGLPHGDLLMAPSSWPSPPPPSLSPGIPSLQSEVLPLPNPLCQATGWSASLLTNQRWRRTIFIQCWDRRFFTEMTTPTSRLQLDFEAQKLASEHTVYKTIPNSGLGPPTSINNKEKCPTDLLYSPIWWRHFNWGSLLPDDFTLC